MYNLLHEPWIPVQRKNKDIPEYISPHRITEAPAAGPVISVAAPRPDFNGALLQFMIGLVQTAYPPESKAVWQEKFIHPPSCEELKAAFLRYADAFYLDGNGPRFMQDHDLVKKEGRQNTVDRLFMEMPGEQTREKNTDHFVKRGTVGTLCPSCCAMALFTLQTNAPAGGRGHRTSLRGGGPLTTFVMGRTLWETIWLNVLPPHVMNRFGNAKKTGMADIFPWMGHIRTSTNNETTTPRQASPLQMFWGMPRRIQLTFEDHTDAAECDLCGCRVHTTVSRYTDKSYGTHYSSGWHHTLSPGTTDPKTGSVRPRLGQPGGFSYRDVPGFIGNCTEREITRRPAVAVQVFREEREPYLADIPGFPFRLLVFGYDMDKMKVRGWQEGSFPLICVGNGIRSAYDAEVSGLVKTADLIAFNVRVSVKKALVMPGATAAGNFSAIDAEFWQDTGPEFYRVVKDVQETLKKGQSLRDLNLQWLAFLTREGMLLFDRYVQPGMIPAGNPGRIARAQKNFLVFSSPYNKQIAKTLGLQNPPAQGQIISGTDLTGTRPDLCEAFISWWSELDTGAGHDRAALRHCRTPREVARTPAFHRLKMRSEMSGLLTPDTITRLAIIAGVLSHVTENKPDKYEPNVNRSFAARLARPPPKRIREKKPCVSGPQFRELLALEDPDSLYTAMIRLVRLLGGSVDIAGLSRGIFQWNKCIKKEWAYAYYAQVPGNETKGV